MAKRGNVWVDDQSYYDKYKDRVVDLGEVVKTYSDLKPDTLLISKSDKEGYVKVVYVSKKGNVYESTVVGVKDNTYLVLSQLAERRNHLFTSMLEITKLGMPLMKKDEHTDSADHYGRIRYAIDYLRDKMDLKDHKDEDPFVTAKGFGLMCTEVIKRI